jgi:hypothetical protein
MKTIALLFLSLIYFSFPIQAQCGLDPLSGTTTINTPSLIVNSYYPGLGNPIIGDMALTVDPIDSRGNATILANDDLILIIQMQGADIDPANSNAYGDGTAGGSGNGNLSTNVYAGYYEYNTVASVAGSTINLAFSLTNNYYNRDFGASGIQRYQVIRVPRNYNLTIDGTGSVTAPTWNGSTGGVAILDAANVLTINGTVNVNGLGFRGGGGINLTGAVAGNTNGSGPLTNTDYRWNSPVTTAANLTGGAKGEGIAGTPRYVLNPGSTTITTNTAEGYVNGSMGRGAPGNAGGGSTDGAPVGAGTQNQYNTGGGGGGNAGAGGLGGSGWHGGTGNVDTYPFGGHGGGAFTDRDIRRLIMGGGGGAGTANNSTAVNQYMSSGASGGGIILLRAGSFAGTGTLTANGASAIGTPPAGTNTDAAGGGGAGGTIVAVTRGNVTVGLSGVNASATGGTGGNMQAYFDHGPGGGGGGGLIITNGAFASTNVNGGANGLTRSGTAAGPLNNSYGALPGTIGEIETLTEAPIMINVNNGASPCGTLPISLTDFSANLDDASVHLNWEVTDAINFSRFIVEHSDDGTSFTTIGEVQYVNSQANYYLLHSPVITPVNYYRLKLVDIDGSYKYSNTLLVRVSAGNAKMVVFPQPARNHFTVNISSANNQVIVLQLFNSAGTRVKEKRTQVNNGNTSILFNNLQQLPSGVYMLRTVVDNVPMNTKIILSAQ